MILVLVIPSLTCPARPHPSILKFLNTLMPTRHSFSAGGSKAGTVPKHGPLALESILRARGPGPGSLSRVYRGYIREQGLTMEKQMQKNMENDMDTSIQGSIVSQPERRTRISMRSVGLHLHSSEHCYQQYLALPTTSSCYHEPFQPQAHPPNL